MRGFLTAFFLAAIGAFGGWLVAGHEAGATTAAEAKTTVVRIGDRIRVLDAPIGCRVVRVKELGRRVAIDCRRAGRLESTYGTLFTSREAAVVRFESKRIGKLVVVAEHEGDVRRCD